jgi:hypothetical protein
VLLPAVPVVLGVPPLGFALPAVPGVPVVPAADGVPAVPLDWLGSVVLEHAASNMMVAAPTKPER